MATESRMVSEYWICFTDIYDRISYKIKTYRYVLSAKQVESDHEIWDSTYGPRIGHQASALSKRKVWTYQ